jgi:ABC-type amino acid transport substrate-binding protein
MARISGAMAWNGELVKVPARSAKKVAAGNGNGNGKLPSLSEGKIDFVMRSFEAAMALPAEEPVDVADTVVRGTRKQRT